MVFDELFSEFQADSTEIIARVEAILLGLGEVSVERRLKLLQEAKRELHTLKGNSGMMGLQELQVIAHEVEDDLQAIDQSQPEVTRVLQGLDRFTRLMVRQAPAAAEKPDSEPSDLSFGFDLDSVRVPYSVLSELMSQIAETITIRNRLSNAIERGLASEEGEDLWDEAKEARDALEKPMKALQDRIIELRLVPIQTLFGRLKRIVHDESRREGKEVRLETSGGRTTVDKMLLETAGNALGHLVRNAVVHGVETPERRLLAGKAPQGTVKIAISTQSGEVRIEVADDGRGMDAAVLERMAQERGISVPEGDEPFAVLFAPGFTTWGKSDLSAGRGMGLCSVLSDVCACGGRIHVDSVPGKGSSFKIGLPINVSIAPVLLARADGERYGIPLRSVVTCVPYRAGDGHLINQAGVLCWRGTTLPLLDIGQALGTSTGLREKGCVIIIETLRKRRALLADEIIEMSEVLISNLDPIVGHLDLLAGTTILGDGRVVLILEPEALVRYQPWIRS